MLASLLFKASRPSLLPRSALLQAATFASSSSSAAPGSQNARLASKRSIADSLVDSPEDPYAAVYDKLESATLPGDSPPTNDLTTERKERPRLHTSWGHGHLQNSFISPRDFLDKDDVRRFRRRRAPVIGPGAYVSRQNDAFHQLKIDPLYEAMNPTLLSHFVTEMGKIKKRAQTGLTWRSQRRVTKAIKRAKLMGIMPMFYRRADPWFVRNNA